MNLAITLFALVLVGSQGPAGALDPFDLNVRTGIPVGERIPRFRAVDQNGRWWDFDSIKGPNGAVLLFHRSADW